MEMALFRGLCREPNDSKWYVLADPSQFLSFETVSRPSKRSRRNGVPLRNVGCGNVHMYNQKLFYANILIEATLEEKTWSSSEGAPRFQHAMTFRVLTARLEINYGETVAEHACVWDMPPDIEKNQTLLSVHHLATLLLQFNIILVCTDLATRGREASVGKANCLRSMAQNVVRDGCSRARPATQ